MTALFIAHLPELPPASLRLIVDGTPEGVEPADIHCHEHCCDDCHPAGPDEP